MGKYFGTDGFRGEAGRELTSDHAYRIGRFLGGYHRKEGRGKILIGKDTRRSGYMLEYALVSGIVACGSDAYMLHVTTTPSVAYTVRQDGFDCGIMISASHNPFYDNGIKLINARGEKMGDKEIALVEDYIDGKIPQYPFLTGAEIGKTVDYIAGRNRYIGYLISLCAHSFRGVKVGLDCANGSSWSIAKAVFDALGAETHLIGATPDGININRDCGSTHLSTLQSFVKEKGLDVGFAFDGDADRCLCVDEKGNEVDGDKILYICGKYMKEKGILENNTVVATVMSNFALPKALEQIGIRCETTAVGDRYVYERMVQSGSTLGGEQSGHIIFSGYATTGDGILTSLRLMEVMLSKRQKMSELASEIELYPQVILNVRVSKKDNIREQSAVQAAVKKAENALSGEGRVLLRASGTEPVIRVLVEGRQEALCRELAEAIAREVEKAGK